VNQLTWFHCNWRLLIQNIPRQAVTCLQFLLLFLQIVKIVGPNGKLISSEKLRLIYILLQGLLEGKEGDGVAEAQQAADAHHGCQSNNVSKLPVIIFIALSEIKKITQRTSPVVALT
jgi:hypothetical protein